MEINITLFVQVLNFLITYLFLNKYLFKPVISSLNRKKQERNRLLSDIENQEEQLLLQEKFKKEQLLQFQKKLKEEYPAVEVKPHFAETEIKYDRDERHIKELIHRSKDIIIKKVFDSDKF